MKKILSLLLFILLLVACSPVGSFDEMPSEEKWTERVANLSNTDSLVEGSTYLSVYSHIYSFSQHKIHDLTATISLRNKSKVERVFIKSADYYNNEGKLIKNYLKDPIYLNPMETAEIIILEKDVKGGTGGNFVFDWAALSFKNKPLFEAVMIATKGKHGLSFTTVGSEI